MSVADKKYKELILDIYNNGTWDTDKEVRAKYADGTPAYSKSVFSRLITFEEDELPLLTCKKVYWKASLKELWLMWIKQSMTKEDFETVDLGIWNSWLYKDGPYKDTLGKAYSYQFTSKEKNQVQELLYNLVHNPSSKRHQTSFWNYEDSKDKALLECQWSTQWHVREDKLDLVLLGRSNDVPVGTPFNEFQYKCLQVLIAYCVGLKPGRFSHFMGNVHYYDKQEEDILKLLDLPEYEQPKLILDTSKGTDFFSYTWEDFKLEDYDHGPFIPFEVAI